MRPNRYKSKYGSVKIKDDGFTFDSKLEHAYYRQLHLRVNCGEVLYFLCQVPVRLRGGVKMVIDFVEFMSDGDVRYTEIKGVETQTYKVKKKLLESLYPIKLNVLKQGDF